MASSRLTGHRSALQSTLNDYTSERMAGRGCRFATVRYLTHSIFDDTENMDGGLGKLPQSMQEAAVYFADTEKAHKLAIGLRWPNGIVCPRCGSTEHSFISTRRIWFCKGCRKQFTLKVGSIFEDSPLGMDKWMLAVWLLVTFKNEISSYEVASRLGITQKSAWRMMHRVRKAVQSVSFLKFSGERAGTSSQQSRDVRVGGVSRKRSRT